MRILFAIALMLAAITASSQKNFKGIIKYRLSVVGADENDGDSMHIVFDNERLQIRLFLPDDDDPGKIVESISIQDLKARRSYSLFKRFKNYVQDTLWNTTGISYTDTKKIMMVLNTVCYHYKANPAELTDGMSAADCLASANLTSPIREYHHLSHHPIILDNRIVLDYIVTQTDGIKARIFAYEVTPLENVDAYFSLEGLKELK